MYTALYRTFRPEVFEDILGQEHIVRILKNQLNQNTASHAYLFCGTRGTGKTSTARILAKGLNCLKDEDRPCGACENCMSIKEGTFLDVIEIDAASNNGVDNIRELRESVKYSPVKGRTKVYIIDEVHMLSTGAFNALLKTLEEPPENVVFILATTEPQKLPATILSRCLRLDFKRVPENILKQSMRVICDRMEVKISPVALGIIAANADGSVRDGLSILDQCIAAGDKKVSREDVLEILGTSGEDVFVEMTDFIFSMDVANSLLLLDKVLADGKDVRQFIRDFISHFRGLLMTKFIKSPEDLLNMSWENVERIRSQSESLELQSINNSIIELSKTAAEAKWSTQPRILLELCLVRMATLSFGEGMGQNATLQRPIIAPNSINKEVSVASKTTISSSETSNGESSEQENVKHDKVKKPKAKLINNEQLWQALFEEAESGKASFNLLRSGTSLTEVGENIFKVTASNDLMIMYLKDNKGDIEAIMSRLTERPLRMESLLEGSQNTKRNLADTISSKLGLNIEIE